MPTSKTVSGVGSTGGGWWDAGRGVYKMVARIYKPAKTAMQSGQARTKEWTLEYEPESPKEADPLMGWTSSCDMKSQIRLNFATKEEAVAYAARNGVAYRIYEETERKRVKRSYSDNFKFGRIGSWTH
jgi:hypothetical protein